MATVGRNQQTGRRSAAPKPFTDRELEGLKRVDFGKHDRVIKRLIATVLEERSNGVIIRDGDVKWIGWPDLDPVHRTPTDWLRLSVLAYAEYELARLDRELRKDARWDLWEPLE